MFKNDVKNYVLLLTVSVVIFLLMLPLKNQVFSEDFAYAQSVRHLLNSGELKVSERLAPASISHIVWGTIITKIFGFSLANLHLAVVLLLPLLLISLYKLLQFAGISRQRSIIFTLFFLSIPWILQLTFTFLTDGTFLTLEVLSLLFYLKGFKNNSSKHLLMGSAFAATALLTRQLGLSIILAAAVMIISKKESWNHKIKQLFACVALPVLAFALYFIWLSFPGNTTIAQYSVVDTYKNVYFQPGLDVFIGNIASLIHKTLNFTSQAMAIYSPLVFLLLISNLKRTSSYIKSNISKLAIVTFIALCIYALDILNFKQGYTLGFPLLIYDYEYLPIPWPNIWKFLILFTLPVLSYTIYLQFSKMFHLKTFGQFTLLSFIFLTAMTVMHVASWEQYIVPFLPIALLWISALTKKLKLNAKIALAVIFILLLDSFQMTKFRYDQSGLIWDQATQLVNRGVSPNEIDPNNNSGWYYWFYFEKLAQDSIKSKGGDKRGLNYGFIIEKPNFPKYRIYSAKTMNYTLLDISSYNVKVIPFKSFLVKDQIYYFELRED